LAGQWAEIQVDCGALARHGIDRDVAAQLDHEAVDLGQAQARALLALGGEERLQGLAPHVFLHADTAVGHGQPDPGLRTARAHQAPRARRRPGAFEVVRPDPHDAAVRHGMACVGHQVDHGHLQLRVVELAAVQAHGQAGVDAHRAGRLLQDGAHLRDRLAQVRPGQLQFPLAGEGHEVAREPRAGGDGPLAGVHGGPHRVVTRLRQRRQQGEVVADDPEHVAEVVGNAAGEAPQRLQLFRLRQPLPAALALRGAAHPQGHPRRHQQRQQGERRQRTDGGAAPRRQHAGQVVREDHDQRLARHGAVGEDAFRIRQRPHRQHRARVAAGQQVGEQGLLREALAHLAGVALRVTRHQAPVAVVQGDLLARQLPHPLVERPEVAQLDGGRRHALEFGAGAHAPRDGHEPAGSRAAQQRR
jgi:hypothetical protein